MRERARIDRPTPKIAESALSAEDRLPLEVMSAFVQIEPFLLSRQGGGMFHSALELAVLLRHRTQSVSLAGMPASRAGAIFP